MTYALIARSRQEGLLGAAIVGAAPTILTDTLCWRPTVGLALSLADGGPELASAILDRVQEGSEPGAALDAVLAEDAQRESRQVAVTTRGGRSAARTGGLAAEFRGHVVGENWVCLGNLVRGAEVLDVTIEALLATDDLPLAERLILAVSAGDRAGGLREPLRSAGIVVLGRHGRSSLELHVDDDPDPLGRLERLYRSELGGQPDRRPSDPSIVIDLEEDRRSAARGGPA
jgi:uncharacterized Ntn-hydrolase superfamily protein